VRGDRAGVAAQRAVRQVRVEELADRARQPRHRRRRRAERRQRQRELRERRLLDADEPKQGRVGVVRGGAWQDGDGRWWVWSVVSEPQSGWRLEAEAEGEGGWG